MKKNNKIPIKEDNSLKYTNLEDFTNDIEAYFEHANKNFNGMVSLSALRTYLRISPAHWEKYRKISIKWANEIDLIAQRIDSILTTKCFTGKVGMTSSTAIQKYLERHHWSQNNKNDENEVVKFVKNIADVLKNYQ